MGAWVSEMGMGGAPRSGQPARGRALAALAACLMLGIGAVAFARDWPAPGRAVAGRGASTGNACAYVERSGPTYELLVMAGTERPCDLLESETADAAGTGRAADPPPLPAGTCLYVLSGGPAYTLSLAAGLEACDLARRDPVSAAGLGPPVGPPIVCRVRCP